jgi:transmembrane sensor
MLRTGEKLSHMTTAPEDLVAIRREAIAWLIRIQETPENASLRAALENWLGRDLRHAAVWRGLTQLDGAIAKADRHRRTRRRAVMLMGTTVLALGLAWLAWPTLSLRITADHASGVGEIKTVTLADGSAATLAPLSAIAVEQDPGVRRVRLLKGQAWFEVKADAARPFRVEAGEAEATVLGTAFSVSLTAEGAAVAVASGSVRVNHARLRLSERLAAGSMLALTQNGARREMVRSDTVAPWRHGLLIMREQPLRDVIDAMRPWLPGIVVTRGSALSRQRVTGVYDMRHPEDSLAMLAQVHGLSITRLTPFVTVVTAN